MGLQFDRVLYGRDKKLIEIEFELDMSTVNVVSGAPERRFKGWLSFLRLTRG